MSTAAKTLCSRTPAALNQMSASAPRTSAPPITASQKAWKGTALRAAPPLAVTLNGKLSLMRPVATALAMVHCTDMAVTTAPVMTRAGIGQRRRYRATKCSSETAKLARMGPVKTLSGTATLNSRINGTLMRFMIAMATPSVSAPSQLTQPVANSRFCSPLSALPPGSSRCQCFLMICRPP